MFKLMVKEVSPGMKLARPIFHPIMQEQMVLPRGAALAVDDIAQLHELGVYDLWVTCPDLETVDRLVSPETAAAHPRLVEMLRQSVAPAALGINASRAERDEAIGDLVLALEVAVARPVLSAAFAAAPDALLIHSFSVAYLALLLGRRLDDYLVEQRRRLPGSRAKELIGLALGCLLHDIGETRLPESQREGRRSLHDPDTTWRQHAEYGFEMIRNQIEPSAAAVVLHHHQHFDGSGFPAAGSIPQRGAQIHVFARLAAAADTFVQLLKEDGVNRPAANAWTRVQQSPCASWLDPVVLTALTQLTLPFAPGLLVALSDGRKALVADIHTESPSSPVVRVLSVGAGEDVSRRSGARLDLSHSTHLWITAVDGVGLDMPLCSTAARSAHEAAVEELALA